LARSESLRHFWKWCQIKTDLNPDELRERLDKLKELRVMPEDRADGGDGVA